MENRGMSFCWLLVVIIAHMMVGMILPISISSQEIALPSCPEYCGNIKIPYPFGIGDDCHYNHKLDGPYYNLTCDNNNTLTYGAGVEVTNITLEGEIHVNQNVAFDCYNYSKGMISNYNKTTSIRLTRFTLSTTQNSLVAIGCDTSVWFSGRTSNTSKLPFLSGCSTMCSEEQQDVVKSSCSGVGCCKAAVPQGVSNISVEAISFYNHSDVRDFNPCSIAFVVANDAMNSSLINQLLPKSNEFLGKFKLPMVFNWSIGIDNCEIARAARDSSAYLCTGSNTLCIDSLPDLGYRCECKHGFRGNPYLNHCKDINECDEERHKCEKPSHCVNTIGGYYCSCPRGYNRRNGTNDNDPCIRDTTSLAIKLVLGVVGGILVPLMVALWFYWQYERRRLIKMRENFFHQNGGHILESKLSTSNAVKMFKSKEINKATNNYNDNCIIGRGGFGMVYKGILTNHQTVAIKKSLKVDSDQVDQFINEIIALSHVTHKNVVKLLGCCLESDVPLLVYEYIRNGTLHDHLHDETKVKSLTWEVRLRIAAEVSSVLDYLHTKITIPIIHRDIKSMNILLNENYIAKVSDFGASKLVPTDQDQLGTMVQGTCGYLDPEYLQTGELTEKSDVYSFGVVLAELLTREKALSYAKPGDEKCLAIYFLRKLKEDRLLEILDDNIVSEGAIEQLKEVANITRKCLKVKGEDRPSMKQVARELEEIAGKSMDNHGDGIVFQEEREYLLGEMNIDKDEQSNVLNNASNGESRVVQMVPLNDGR